LVLRLASLLWRIRRATSIETDLLRTQAQILHDRRLSRDEPADPVCEHLGARPLDPCELPEASPNDADLNPANINRGDRPTLLTTWRDPA